MVPLYFAGAVNTSDYSLTDSMLIMTNIAKYPTFTNRFVPGYFVQ